ncbi:MAG: prepilin-type N-terminal cleavage/methylation domain-containing protein [Nitrospira sp. CR2.1]|nr:prepilin-type N-terminal cleavage/methylation domain-containing protein [Nitrospira sp. CR2.1]
MNERGVSLVELCVVLAVLAVVMAVSVPGWAALVAKHRQRAVVTEIASELRMARQLAMARHERVRVVVNAEQSELRTECMDCDQRALRRYEFGRTGTVVDSMSTRPEIVFQPSGRSATATTMVLVDSRRVIHQLTVSLTGRVVVS